MQSDIDLESSQRLYDAYEEVTSKKGPHRFNEELWKTIADGLRSGTEIRLTKQTRFLTLLYEVYEHDDANLLELMTEILSTLRCKYQHVFHPTLSCLINLFTSCTQHAMLTRSHQSFIRSALDYIDQLLSNQPARKSFELVCNKMLVPWANIRSRLDDCSTLDNLIARNLFSQNIINELRSSHSQQDAEESKKPRFQSFSLKLFENLQEIPAVGPILFKNYLQFSQKFDKKDEASDCQRQAADMNISLAFLDVIASPAPSDDQLILFTLMFSLIREHRLYHPNRDDSNAQRSKFVSLLDYILAVNNPELISNAIAALLGIDHLFIEGRLVSIWKLIGDHREELWSRNLATDIVTAYADLRQIRIALQSFLESDINMKLSSLVPSTQYLRIPSPQLPLLIDELLPKLSTKVNPIAVCDVIVTILDTMREQIPDNYQHILDSLNQCSQLPLDQRISVYTAARRVRSRRNLFVLLPDQVTGLPFDFLLDLEHVEHNLLHSYNSLTPEILSAVVYCLDDIQCRSLAPVSDTGKCLVRHLLQLVTSCNWHMVSAHIELLLNFAESESIDVIAEFIVLDNLQPLLLQPLVLESRQLRSALVHFLTRSICERPALVDALSELPADYLDDPDMEPVASVIFKNVSSDHPIWIQVASLKHWPLMKLNADALFNWLLPSSQVKTLLKLILSQKLSQLVESAVRHITDIDQLCIVTEVIVEHVRYQFLSCSEAFYRPIDYISENKPTFVIDNEFCKAIGIIAERIPQECQDDSMLKLISLLLRFQALSSSEFVQTNSVDLPSIVNRIPTLIDSVQGKPPSDSSRLVMASIAAVMQSVDNRQLCLDAIFKWLILDPHPEICSAFCEASKPSDFEALVVFLRPHLPSSVNAVLTISSLLNHIRYRTGHCRIIEKYATSLINGLGSAIGQGIDHAVDAVFAIVNHLQSVKLSVHQVALIISALHPLSTRWQQSDIMPSVSRLMFALVRYRHDSIVPSLPVLCELLIRLFRDALQSKSSNASLLDNLSRVFVELSRLQPTVSLAPRLIAEYCRTMALKPKMTVEERQAAIPGVMALFDIADREQIQAAFGVLDSTAQALFHTCHKEYLRTYKYYGKS